MPCKLLRSIPSPIDSHFESVIWLSNCPTGPTTPNLEKDFIMAAKASTKTAPAKAAPAEAPTEETIFGVSDVADLIKERTGQTVKTRDLRILLRKLARDGRLQREIVAGNRARWEFAGADDPSVATIIEAFENGELDADKKEKLDALKARKAEQKAAAAAEKAAAEASEGDDEVELED